MQTSEKNNATSFASSMKFLTASSIHEPMIQFSLDGISGSAYSERAKRLLLERANWAELVNKPY